MSKKLNIHGQDLNLIRQSIKPIWKNFLIENNLTPRQANDLGWNLNVLVEETALDLRVADEKN